MLVENPLALRYIFADDIYVLPNEQQPVMLQEPVIELLTVTEITETVSIAKKEDTDQFNYNNVEVAAVTIDDTPQATVAEAATAYQTPNTLFNYSGDNQKNILILVHYPEHEVMEAAHLKALEATLNRLTISLQDVAILNIYHHLQHPFETISAYFKPERLLILGAESFPAGLPVQPLNQLKQARGRKMLHTYSFNQMMGNKDFTRGFWEQMKNF